MFEISNAIAYERALLCSGGMLDKSAVDPRSMVASRQRIPCRSVRLGQCCPRLTGGTADGLAEWGVGSSDRCPNFY